MEYLIGIDIGTGSTKAIALDTAGNILASARASYPIISPKPSYSEQDPSLIFNAFTRCISDITGALRDAPVAISLSCAMHSIIPVSSDGKALMNMICWADNRSEDVADRLKESVNGRTLYETGGTPIHPMSPITKIIWLRENEPSLFNQADKFISIKEYVWYKLFNTFEIDYSLASATGLFNIQSLTWNEDALAIAGVDHSRLSSPANTDTKRTLTDPATLTSLGLSTATTFIIGASDGCLANLGSLAIHSGTAALTIGTSGAIRVTGTRPVFNYNTMPFNYRLDESTFVTGGPINNGGVAFKWYVQKFLQLKLESDDDYKSLISQIDSVSPGCDGLIFLPYILGERAPLWNSTASGVFFGITATHTQAHFTRAVMEGISMSLYAVCKTLEEGGLEIDSINVSGGIVNNDHWIQLLSDVFGKQACIVNAEDASARGAIYLAMKALGMVQTYEHFKSASPESFYPDKQKTEQYHTIFFPRFQRLYEILKKEMTLTHLERIKES